MEFAAGVDIEVKLGSTNEDALQSMDFAVEGLLHDIRNRHLNINTTMGQGFVLGLLQSYPYLTRE
jgi:arginine decarboxylase